MRAFPGSFRNFSRISSGKSQPYWGYGPVMPLLADKFHLDTTSTAFRTTVVHRTHTHTHTRAHRLIGNWCPHQPKFRRTREGCGGLGGENSAVFLQARPIFQQPFSLPESAQTLAGIAFRAAGKSQNHFPAASKFAEKTFPEGNFGQPQPSRVF